MIEKLIKKIEFDLNIKRFVNETKRDYNQRLIYSIAASWVRTLIYGNSLKSSEEASFPDIMFIQTNLTNIIETFLKFIEINDDWTDIEQSEGRSSASIVASTVIQDMIYLGEIAEVNERQISHINVCEEDFEYYTWLRGKSEIGQRMIGASIWRHNQDKLSFYDDRIIKIKGDDYYEYLFSRKDWKDAKLSYSYEILKIGVTNSYFKNWVKFDSNKIPDGIFMIRTANEFDKAYFLIKKENGSIKMLTLDEWYWNTRETYRIMFALNLHYGTPALFRKKEYDDYVQLEYATALPDYENRIIMACSWPDGSINNRFRRIIPKDLWYIVEENLNYLGIRIEDKKRKE